MFKKNFSPTGPAQLLPGRDPAQLAVAPSPISRGRPTPARERRRRSPAGLRVLRVPPRPRKASASCLYKDGPGPRLPLLPASRRRNRRHRRTPEPPAPRRPCCSPRAASPRCRLFCLAARRPASAARRRRPAPPCPATLAGAASPRSPENTAAAGFPPRTNINHPRSGLFYIL